MLSATVSQYFIGGMMPLDNGERLRKSAEVFSFMFSLCHF